MSVAKKFTLGLYWNILGKLFFSALGFLISVAIARGLGKDDFGIYASLLAIPVVLRLFTSFGFETILNIFLPAQDVLPEGKKKIRFLVKRLLFYRFFIIIGISFALSFGRSFLGQIIHSFNFSNYYVIIILYFAVLLLSSYSNMILRAVMQIKLVSILECFAQILNLLFLVCFFPYSRSVYTPLLAFIIANIIVTVVSLIMAKSYILGESIACDTKQLFNIGFTGFIGSILVFGLGRQIDILIMNYFGVSNSNIGYYYLSFSLAAMVSILLQGIGSLSQSVFSQKYTTEGQKGLKISWEMVTKVSIILSIPFYIFAIFFAKDILTIFYGKQYLEATNLFQVIAVFNSLDILIGSGFCMPVFYLINRKTEALKIFFFSGMLNLVLDIILIPKYGVIGAVYATGLSSILSGLLMLQLVIKIIKVQYPIVFSSKVIVISLLAILPTLVFNGDGILLILISKAVIYFTCFALIAMVFKPLRYEERNFVKMVDDRLYAIVKYF